MRRPWNRSGFASTTARATAEDGSITILRWRQASRVASRVAGGLRLRPPDAGARRECPAGKGGAGQQSAAAHRRDHGVERGRLLHQLQRGRGLPGDDLRMVEGMDQGCPGGCHDVGHRGIAGAHVGCAADDARALRGDVVQFHLRRALGHHHDRLDAAQPAGHRDRCAMVAGTLGRHAARGDGIGQGEHRVAGATELECARALEVLALEMQRSARQRIQRGAVHHRRGGDPGTDARGGVQHVGPGGQGGVGIGVGRGGRGHRPSVAHRPDLAHDHEPFSIRWPWPPGLRGDSMPSHEGGVIPQERMPCR